MNVPYSIRSDCSSTFPLGGGGKSAKGQSSWRSRRKIDFSGRATVLAKLQRDKHPAKMVMDDVEASISNDELAARLAWPRDVLLAHAAILADRGMPIAHIYAAAAAVSVERSILSIAAAEQQEGWPAGGMEDFHSGSLAEWL